MISRRTAQTQPSTLEEVVVPRTIDEIVSEIFSHRRIDKATQQRLMNALLVKTELNSQDEAQVKRVFDALHQGRLRVVE